MKPNPVPRRNQNVIEFANRRRIWHRNASDGNILRAEFGGRSILCSNSASTLTTSPRCARRAIAGADSASPSPVEAARICEAAGAHGITAHLREDRRHIQDRDIWELREKIETRLNLEMANVPEIIAIALKLRPAIVCIVPERRLEVTTEGGLDVVAAEKSLTETRMKMNDAGIEVSLFIAPDEKQIEASARTGSQFIELHTGQFAEEFLLGAPASRRRVPRDQSRNSPARCRRYRTMNCSA